jgi:hypothetical protein
MKLELNGMNALQGDIVPVLIKTTFTFLIFSFLGTWKSRVGSIAQSVSSREKV